jgi:hypothetical protein
VGDLPLEQESLRPISSATREKGRGNARAFKTYAQTLKLGDLTNLSKAPHYFT